MSTKLERVKLQYERDSARYLQELEKAFQEGTKLRGKQVINRPLSAITTKQYISRLKAIHNDLRASGKQRLPLISASQFTNTTEVDNIISKKGQSTRASYYSAIIKAFSVHTGTKLEDIEEHYRNKLMEVRGVDDALVATREKTEKQEKSMIESSEIEERKKEMKESLKLPPSTIKEYNQLLNYIVLSLYTDIAPRRNMDYALMYVMEKPRKNLLSDRNYYDVKNKEFIFNKYKTSDTFGQQRVKVPSELKEKLDIYIKYHPGRKTRSDYPLIVNYDGTMPNMVNGITRILQRAIGKEVGSTALRHIYLSEKYGDTMEEMEADSSAMAHSMEVQREYVKRRRPKVAPEGL